MAEQVRNPNQAQQPREDELKKLAFHIYGQKAAYGAIRRDGKREAIQSFRQAKAFLEAAKLVDAGELDISEPKGPQLSECCAPNLPPTHPHNLVARDYVHRKSQRHYPGDLVKVNRIKKWLDAHGTTPEDELLPKLNNEFPDLNWDAPTLHVAQAIFPAYVTN